MRLLIILAIFISHMHDSVAQVIDASWFLRPGVTIAQVHTFDQDVSQIDFEANGADQVWDFSHVPLNNLVDTTWFLDIDETVFGEHFSGATVCRRNVNPFYDWEWYYRVDNDTIFHLGEAYIRHVGNSLDTMIFSPIPGVEDGIYMYEGFKLGEAFWDSANNFIQYTFQGMGTLITTPQDTFEDAILIRRDFIPTGDVSYRWYQTDFTKELCAFTPPAMINPNSVNNLTRLVYYDDDRTTSSNKPALEQLEDLSISFADGNIILTNDQSSRKIHLSIYTLQGQYLESRNLNLDSGQNILPMDLISELQALVVLCVDKTTQRFLAQKILVNR